jgi:hypothetical protein
MGYVIGFVLGFLFVAGGGLTPAFILGPFGVTLVCVVLFVAGCWVICAGPAYLSYWIDRSGFDNIPNRIIIPACFAIAMLIMAGAAYLNYH